ncbi:hypothetical protein BDW60DRAFT_194624 [Aspergillus nidulans var. acristatus]
MCDVSKCLHDKDDCAADTELQTTLALAKNMRRRRCYACRALVELSTGCYHMSCNCGAQFYLRFKMEECNCLQFGEMRLYATPEAAVEAGANNPRPDVAPEDRLEITVRSVGMVDVFDGPKGG